MNEALLIGLLALGVPLFAVGYFMLRKNTGVFRMFVAMLLIGLGYLTATGALTDIGRKIMGAEGEVMPAAAPVETPAPAPEATPPATEPAPEAPPPAEAPAPDAPAANETAPAPAPAP